MARLRRLLCEEVGYEIPARALDNLLGVARLEEYRAGGTIVGHMQMNPDVFILKQGIIRYSDLDGDKERTFAFGLPGTLFMSMHCFWRRSPSWFQIQACTPAQVLRISLDDYWKLTGTDLDIARWMLHIAHGELWYLEHMNATVRNGSARDRLTSMWRHRPEIIKRVPQKIIASYLDITPEYLSRLKKQLLKE